MSSRITPRRGAALYSVAVDNYAAYYVGEYRGTRDVWLVMAHCASGAVRRDRIHNAIAAHRSMMRCLRELRREQRRMQEAA